LSQFFFVENDETRDDETDSRKDELTLLNDMSTLIQNQHPMVALSSTEHSRRHREREKKRKNQPDHASTAEARGTATTVDSIDGNRTKASRTCNKTPESIR
jgi:hypothetical protein